MATSPSEERITPQSLVNEDDVQKTLQADKGKEAKLTSWKVVDFTKQGDNYACVVTSVEVEYSLNGEERKKVTYVVKLNPCRHIPEFEAFTNVIFIKEAKFYLHILPELNATLESIGKEGLRFPRCFHSNLEERKEQIYFEDLREKEFKMFDRRKGLDEDHVPLVIKELARLHAASYLLQSKTPEDPLEAKFDFLSKDWLTFADNSKDMMLPVMKGYLENSIQMLEKTSGYERAIAWIRSLVPELEDILLNGMKSEKFKAINHGDCWNNNILFKYNDEGKPIEVRLLDLQICRSASVASDLNYFLYTSLTGSVRKPNLTGFLAAYHASYKDVLAAEGQDIFFTEEDLLKEFRHKNVFGAIFGMMILPAMLMEADEVPDFTKKDISVDELMEEFKAKAHQMFDNHPLMAPRFLAIFDELMETGLIP